MFKVDNAIILAAGTSSRFAPLSYEIPKGLVEVKGEKLVERIINQLREKNIEEIIIVAGYKAEQYMYLEKKYNVKVLINNEYITRNNNSSIYVARNYINNSYICPVDNYYINNPFNEYEDKSFYSSLYSKDYTDEWCIEYNDKEIIKKVTIGGQNSWYMAGFVFWDEEFSKKFIKILKDVYNDEKTYGKFWEDIYIENIEFLDIKIKKYYKNFIKEFDSLNELRKFDKSYENNTRSIILKNISEKLNCEEKDISNFIAEKDGNFARGFYFDFENKKYFYDYKTKKLKEIKND